MNKKFVFFLLLLCLPSLPLCAAVPKIPYALIFRLAKSLIHNLRSVSRVGKIFCKIWKVSQDQYTCTSFGGDTNTSSGDSTVDISLGAYPLSFEVGSNQQTVDLIADISLDLTFMLCELSEAVTKNLDVYQRTSSNNFSFIDPCSSNESSCPYNFNYTSPYVTSAGYLSSDIFYFNSGSYSINFGCGYANTGNYGNSIGYIGLGLNSSFLNNLNVNKFSYCLNSKFLSNSPFIFDSNSQLTTASGASTKFLSSQSNTLSYYIITLTGITVGNTSIPILSNGALPKADGTGTMVLSSTSTITYLETSAYTQAKDAFIKQMGLPQAASQFNLDLCFTKTLGQVVMIPQLTLHFDGADMSPINYFSTNIIETVYCLMMLPNDGSDGTSFLGNYMQLDMHMIYDIGNNELQFEPYDDCSSLYS